MNYGITLDFYMGNFPFIHRANKDKNGNKWIFFGATKELMEQAIKEYGSEEEKRSYFGEPKEEKYYKDLFEYMEEETKC